MLIAVLSDTHLSDALLPPEVLDAFGGADMILHAGDLVDLQVLEQLSEVAPTLAVRGNMDHRDAAGSLPESRVIEAGGFRIGLTHGHGPPGGIIRRVRALFDDVDCVVFGHTHQATIEKTGGVLYFNPGSPTDRVFARERTVGLLEVGEELRPRIVTLGEARDGEGG